MTQQIVNCYYKKLCVCEVKEKVLRWLKSHLTKIKEMYILWQQKKPPE